MFCDNHLLTQRECVGRRESISKVRQKLGQSLLFIYFAASFSQNIPICVFMVLWYNFFCKLFANSTQFIKCFQIVLSCVFVIYVSWLPLEFVDCRLSPSSQPNPRQNPSGRQTNITPHTFR